MKKLLLIAAVSSVIFACNDGSKSSTTTSDTTAMKPAMDSAASVKPALQDGLMTLKDGKMMVVKSGSWAPLDSAVTCTNGRKVDLNGEVSKGNKKRKLDEGMMIDKDGQIKDKDGKLMDTSGWD